MRREPSLNSEQPSEDLPPIPGARVLAGEIGVVIADTSKGFDPVYLDLTTIEEDMQGSLPPLTAVAEMGTGKTLGRKTRAAHTNESTEG